VLRALGMTGKRAGRVLTWQGIALALAVALVGIPLGVLLGSILWRVIANELGVGPRPVIGAELLLLVPAAIVVGALAAVVPARRIRHQDIGALLRTE
jgi:putative ABC transport system permease protein